MALHVFVVMPFENKEGIDFDRVYSDYIKPALEREGYEVFRADKELQAGEIRTDMLQELLLADLVVADLSIDNPNVWYELGVRHALRARGIILVQSKREHQPFDVYTDRKLRYHVKDGVPDTAFIEADKAALAAMAMETMASWRGRKISPVYYHLPYLKENDWKSLRVGGVNEFWEKHEVWDRRIKVAQEKMQPGDVIVLAAEAPVHMLQLEAHKRAGKSLVKMGQFAFALEQFEKAITMDPEDLESQQQKGILLGRLKKYKEAKAHFEDLLAKHADSAETVALLGRVEKDAWISTWRKEGRTVEDMRKDAANEEAILRESIQAYAKGFFIDPGHYYSAINTVTLIRLLHHLTGDESQLALCKAMEGGIRWCIQSALSKETPQNKDYWARVTLGDLEVLLSDTSVVEQSYKNAVAVAGNDWFALDSSRQQLTLLRDLGFRPDQVRAALKIFNRALDKLIAPWQPRRVFLFSGHMIDTPGRADPRFPPAKEPIATRAIAEKLDELGAAHSEDIALCGGACGGDLLFAEACLARGLHLEVRIPFDESTFLHESVNFAGDQWRERYYNVKKNPNTSLLIMPDELGPLPFKSNPYERNNLWQLYSALSWGAEKINFICLWNRKGGDGPGGTKHMHDEVRKRAGQVFVLDTNILFKEDRP
jgi:tetratricopeptide (TPR) repeat protein